MEFSQYIDQQHKPFIEALSALIRIPSVLAEGEDSPPFGKSIDDALRLTLKIAEDLGFRVTYGPDGYYGFAEIGQGDGLVAVLGHIDVMPPGDLNLWETGPYEPVEREGKLFGRGAKDDKGPALAALFAAKALMDADVDFKKRLRLIIGTDEESLWRGMKLYNQREEQAELGFTPDAEFPLVYAEKGLLQFTLACPNRGDLKFEGGSSFNAVPDHIFYSGDDEDALAAQLDVFGFAYERTSTGIKVVGRAAHAMSTEDGINAIARLCLALDAMGRESNAVRFVVDMLGEDPYGTGIFGAIEDEPSGRLKCNVGKIKLGEEEKLSIDIRIPVTIAKDRIVDKLLNAAEKYNFTYTERDWLEPLYLPKNHPLIKTLLRVYQEETGDMESEPISSGGATYARTMENCVAFGPDFPGVRSVEHQPNEHIVLAEMYRAMSIYAQAIFSLTRT